MNKHLFKAGDHVILTKDCQLGKEKITIRKGSVGEVISCIDYSGIVGYEVRFSDHGPDTVTTPQDKLSKHK